MPARVSAGAFILNSGLGKLSADEQAAAGMHQMATGAYPFLARMKPRPAALYRHVAGLTAPRMSTTNTSVSVGLIPACELPVFP